MNGGGSSSGESRPFPLTTTSRPSWVLCGGRCKSRKYECHNDPRISKHSHLHDARPRSQRRRWTTSHRHRSSSRTRRLVRSSLKGTRIINQPSLLVDDLAWRQPLPTSLLGDAVLVAGQVRLSSSDHDLPPAPSIFPSRWYWHRNQKRRFWHSETRWARSLRL